MSDDKKNQYLETAEYYHHLSDTMTEIAGQLKRIADQLEAWDSVYKTQAGRTVRSIRTTANVWTQGRI